MATPTLDSRLFEELKDRLDRGLASGELMTAEQVAVHTGHFRDRFGPDALRGLDGEPLLLLMHGRQDGTQRCLVYWLEFKKDEEFAGYRFGGIGGGDATKFGIYQRQNDGAWITGSPTKPRVLTPDEAIQIARRQRDELLAGDAVLRELSLGDTSDEAYSRVQAAMDVAAPELSRDGWAHKYWFLIHSDKLDDYHSPRYQRFHIFKLLQMTPDRVGILDSGAPRFICAGRFVGAARALEVPVSSLNRVLNQRDGAVHRYWRVGTTVGAAGESQWAVMRDGGFVSIGFHDHVPDLSTVIGQEKAAAKEQIRNWLLADNSRNPSVATLRANEILKFAQEISENDLILACEGQNVLGVGRVRDAYEYDGDLAFPHKRPIEWLLLETWHMPIAEGLQKVVYELGKKADNLLELEQRLFRREPGAITPTRHREDATTPRAPLPPLDPFAARIDSILRRKGQVVLYGPPGTGKTYRAIGVARQLAARQAFRKSFSALTETECAAIIGDAGLVRLCSFHPSYGYEDFIEGLRPKNIDGRMVFEPRDGIFKRICTDAQNRGDRNFFLVVDEINRGDVPRIFGELMTVIELDKRKTPITLAATGTSFTAPANVFLVCTMNTADRSITLLDTALRRRFGFVELMPDSSQLSGRTAGSLPLGPWLDALNARIRQHIKRNARNLQIGHAYLLSNPPINSVSEFARIVRDDIIPLLEEYCYEDFNTLKDILGSALVDAGQERIKEELFAPNREEDLIDALSFEEMQPIVLSQVLTGDTLAADVPDTSDEDEDVPESSS
jgi:5-methylcytosine-specific restriction protein B